MSDTRNQDANPDPPIKNMKSQAPTCAKHEAEEFHRWLGAPLGQGEQESIDVAPNLEGAGFRATG